MRGLCVGNQFAVHAGRENALRRNRRRPAPRHPMRHTDHRRGTISEITHRQHDASRGDWTSDLLVVPVVMLVVFVVLES